MIELILGGARSGKSRLAESRAENSQKHSINKRLIYIATAIAHDNEMAERIRQHQLRRSKDWQLVEEPIQLADVLETHNHSNNIILIECLTLWLSNLLCSEEGTAESSAEGTEISSLLAAERQKFIQQLQQSQADIIMVSNETGLGVVPMGELSRRYVDEAGWLHQELAGISDKVTLVVAGLEHTLKA